MSPVSLSRASRVLLIIGSLSLLSATQLSALGFHALRNVLTEAQQESWHWATELQFYHSLGLVLLALLAAPLGNSRLVTIAGALMIVGLLVFSGSIYVNLLGLAPVGQVAPFGGGSFMLAWLLVAIAAFRARSA
ncbi:MAG: DUF423 domain-containing protein [Gammaproteobacteria bacterium]|nr:DUF423 domain-containing protein [Gammaproteobacteria bacterium]MDH5276866.1 DUF423 domain-containing protein [Gammaproteobacteria bacterium]